MNPIIALFIVASMSSCVHPKTAASNKSRSTGVDAVQEKIDVGGYRLNFKYSPGVLPAIVFESSGNLDSSQWDDIHEILSRSRDNAIISYDRSGLGKSDLSEKEYSIDLEVDALRLGLKQLGYEKKVVLISHSYGAFLAQRYVQKFRNSVEYVVFIDPNTVFFVDSMGGADAMVKGEMTNLEQMPEKIRPAMKKQLLSFPETVSTLRETTRSTVHCTVITSGRPWFPTEEMFNSWRLGNEKLAAACGTPLIIAQDSGHMVPRSARSLVVSTIRTIMSGPK